MLARYQRDFHHRGSSGRRSSQVISTAGMDSQTGITGDMEGGRARHGASQGAYKISMQ